MLAPTNLPRIDEIAIDGATLVFAIGMSIFTVIAFGLLPASMSPAPTLMMR